MRAMVAGAADAARGAPRSSDCWGERPMQNRWRCPDETVEQSAENARRLVDDGRNTTQAQYGVVSYPRPPAHARERPRQSVGSRLPGSMLNPAAHGVTPLGRRILVALGHELTSRYTLAHLLTSPMQRS